jgi:hypothetical protein
MATAFTGIPKAAFRFGDECCASWEGPLLSSPEFAPGHFFCSWLKSGRDLVNVYMCGWLLLPLYFVWGLLCIVFKVFLLNPPFFPCLMTRFEFENDLSFPGRDASERMSFAKRFYSTKPRNPEHNNISSRFGSSCVDGPDHIWMEKLAIYSWLQLPPMSAGSCFNEERQQWHIVSSWWTPHILEGCVILGHNPDKTGFMFKAKIRHLRGLGWMYKWLFVQTLGIYGTQLDAVASALPPVLVNTDGLMEEVTLPPQSLTAASVEETKRIHPLEADDLVVVLDEDGMGIAIPVRT